MRQLKRVFPILIVVGLWVVGSNYIDPLFLPKPAKVLDSFSQTLSNGQLMGAAGASFMRIFYAATIAMIISIPLGILVANYRIFDDLITPVTDFMRYLPVTAFYPLLLMWLGLGEQMKVTFLFAAMFFYFLPTTVLCIKETPMDLVDTARTMGMSKFKTLYMVYLPYSLPAMCQSFLMMYGIGWTYVIIAEIVNAKQGLGYIMNVASARGRTDLVFMALITIVVISYVFDTVGNKLIRKAFKWKFARDVNE